MTDRSNIRWTVSVSKETDRSLRRHLAARGARRGDLSRFIEEAVRWLMLEQSVGEARAAFADLPGEVVEALIEEGLTAVRGNEAAEPA